MKTRELNLLKKQSELEKQRDEAKNWYQHCLTAVIGFPLVGIIAFFGTPYITENKEMLEYGRIGVLIFCFFLAVIFFLFMLNYNKSYKKTQQEIKKIEKELRD